MENLTYREFINNILETRGRFNCGEAYYERHHIIPKCVGGTDNKDNLIDLYAAEHFKAHRLLALENSDNEKLVYAWWCMAWVESDTQERYQLTPEEYEEIKTIYSETLSKAFKGENNPFYGQRHTDETRQKISDNHADVSGENNPMYGKPRSEETKKKLSESRKGKCVGEDNPFYGKHHTETTKQKMSEERKGKFTGENNPFYGKKHTEESKAKMRKPRPHTQGENHYLYGKHLPEEIRLKLSAGRVGKYKGGENPTAKKVIRLFDLRIYDCMQYAADDNSMCRHTVRSRCKKKQDFMYYDEWLELQTEQEETDEL